MVEAWAGRRVGRSGWGRGPYLCFGLLRCVGGAQWARWGRTPLPCFGVALAFGLPVPHRCKEGRASPNC